MPTYNAPDLSNYAQMSDLYNDDQLRQDINSRFSNINTFDPSNLQAQITANQQGLANLPAAQAPDLSGYATTSALSDAIGGINTYDDFQLRQDINSRFSNIPQFDASGLQAQITANQQGLANLPTVSAPDLSGYATTNDLTSAISGIDIPSYTPPDLSSYATTNDLTSAISGIPSYQAPDLSGYATSGDLTSAISGIPQFDPTSLQNQITANQTAIGNVPQYNDQGLLAAIQANQNAISGINTYDDTQLRQDINNRFTNFNPNVDLSNYATNASVDTLVNNLPTGQVQDLSNYVTNDQFSQGLQNLPTTTAPDLSGYATTQDLNTAIGGLPTYQAPDLSNYATQSDLSNINTYDDTQLRTDINNRFSNFSPNVDLSNYATNASVNTLMNNLPTYNAPDLSGYATTSQLDSAINALPTYQAPDLSNYAQMNDLYNDSQLRQDMNARFTNFNPNVDLSDYATNESVANQFSNFKPTGPAPYDDSSIRQLIAGNQTAINNLPSYQAPDLSNYATNASVDTLMSNLPTYTAPDLSSYATTSQLDSAINALPTYTAPDLSGYATNAALQQGLSTITPYNDTQLRQDINNRFDNFTPNVDLSNYVTNNQLQQGLGSFNPYNDEALRAEINARFGNISTFDPSSLQAQILALQNANNVVAPSTSPTINPQPAQGLSFAPRGF